MEKALILSPGKKIKQIRKKYKLTQDEVAGCSITRNLISLIESDKAALTPQVAEIVSQNINSLCKCKEISFTTSKDYLLESIEDQIIKHAQEYIDYLSDTDLTLSCKFQSKINAIENFLAEYGLSPIKFEIYYLISEIYIRHNEFSYAYKYCIKAYENSGKLSPDNSKQISLLFSLAFCCDMLGKYTECLDYYAILETYVSSSQPDLCLKLNFNKMIIHKKLEQLDNCLREIDNIEKNFSLETSYLFAVRNTKANCYKSKKLYTKALDTYAQLLDIIDNEEIENKLIVLCNMIETYIILHDTISLKSCIKKSYKLLKSYADIHNQSYSQEIYNDLGLAALEIKDYDKSKEFLLKSIEEFKTYKKNSCINESFEKLIEIYELLNDTTGLNDLKNKLLEFISLELIPRNSMLVLKFIQYYNHIGDSENVQNILNFVL